MVSQSEHDLWNWERCKSKIRGLRWRLGFSEASALRFLGLSVSLEDGMIYDALKNCPLPAVAPNIYCILSGYAGAEPVPETAKLVSFRQLPGGHAYYNAFLGRAVLSIQRVFGAKPRMLVEAAKLLGGTKMSYGDCSVRVHSLPLVPIMVILWVESPEFAASANMLFDESISHYLTTEQIAMLSELTSARLRHASEVLERKSVEHRQVDDWNRKSLNQKEEWNNVGARSSARSSHIRLGPEKVRATGS